MLRSVVRYSIFFAALLILGPLAWWLTGTLRGPDGATHTSPLVSTAGALGLARAAAAIAVAFAGGLVARLFVSPRWAMFTAGGVLAWAAWGAGPIDGLLRTARDGSPLPRLAAEGAVYTLLAILMSLVLARPKPDGEHTPVSPGSRLPLAGIGIALGAAAGALCAWVCAQSTMKGQVLAAATLGGLAAAIAAHVLNPRVPAWSVVAGVVLLGVIGPLVVIATGPAGAQLVLQANAVGIFPAARPLPIDWLAGAFLGVPLGHAWGASMSETRVTPASPARAAA